MKKMLWTGIVCIVLCTAAVLLCGRSCKVLANDSGKTYTFEMEATISGTVGSELQAQVYTISFKNGTKLVRSLPAGTDISSWFMGEQSPFPAGMKAKVKEDAAIGATTIKVEFTGLIWGASCDTVKLLVQNIYFDADESDWYSTASVIFSGTAPKYNTTREFSAPSGYTCVCPALYFNDGGAGGWKLNGNKGVALSGNNELNIIIDGNFLVPISANSNISHWFTGDLTVHNTLLNTIVGSSLPEGVTARLKNAVKVGDNSFTIVFSGTPTKGCKNIISFTIPKGYTSWNKYFEFGDSTEALKVTNTTQKYAYNIESPDYTDYYSQFVKITMPDAEVEGGQVVTEEDNLIVTMELFGSVNGTQLKFNEKYVKVGMALQSGLAYQDPRTGRYNDLITTYLGLKGKVKSISEDGTKLTVILTGTAKKPGSHYPNYVGGSGFILHPSATTAGCLIQGIVSDESTLYVVEPTLDRVSVNKDIRITKTAEENTTTINDRYFTIDLGGDTVAKNMKSGQALELFYRHTGSSNYDFEFNGITFYLDREAKVGDKELYVRVNTFAGDMGNYKGYLKFSLPKDYINRTNDYGTQDYYDIPFSRVYIDTKKTEREWIKADKFKISGTPNWGVIDSAEGYTVGITDVGPIGTGKVRFTITLDQDLSLQNDYEAGDSVNDLVKIRFKSTKNSPFYYEPIMDYFTKKYGEKFTFYTIRTTEAITKDNPDKTKPRVLHLEIDLKEFYALTIFKENADLGVYAIYRTGTQPCFEWYWSEGTVQFDIHLKGESGDSENFDSGIVYNKKDVIVYAKDASGENTEGTYINLTTEKFVTDLDYKCYSIDGGEKWKAATKKLTDKNISSMLNKGMTFVIADKFDSKAKKPSNDAIVYTFATLNARPAAPKFKVDYAEYADQTGATRGQWALTDASGAVLTSADLVKLDIGATDSKGKTVTEAGYGSWPSTGGLNVAPIDGTKVAAHTYFVRVAPTTDTPASKVVKVKVKGQQKAPKLKVDYKKETLKVKKDMIVYFDDTPSASAEKATGELKAYSDLAGKYIIVDEEMAKNGIDISAYITNERNTIMVWSGATSKKASTAAQTIVLAARQEIAEEELSPSGGKLKLDKKYEVYDEAKDKWGSLPKVEASCELKIRLKATAKGGAESDSTYAASNTATLAITYGEYEAGKDKLGIKAADIVIK